MAVVGNTSSEIGDVMIFNSDTVLSEIMSISNFTDITTGETVSRFFEKKFTYSLDGGLNFNTEGYINLNSTNLANIPIDPSYDFIIEYRYERLGTDTSGILSWTSTSLITTNRLPNEGPVFTNSVFSSFTSTWHNPIITKWKLNVLEKLYVPGIIPISMIRNQNQNVDQEDRDFIDFWRTITHFYSLLVYYAREFEDYRNNRSLLIEYLRQRGMFVCENTELVYLQYLQENFWDEMRHRGSSMISQERGALINNTPKPVDGELLRLVCYNRDCDEFLFGISEENSIGWTVNEWSPLWQGLSHQPQFNKLYEKSVEVKDLLKYPLINPANISIVNDPGAGDVMIISGVAAGAVSGVGVGGDAFSAQFSTNVDISLSYELKFLVKVKDTGSGIPKLTAGINAFNENGVVTQLSESTGPGYNPGNISLSKVSINDDGLYYEVSVLIHPRLSVYTGTEEFSKTSIGIGNNFVFNSSITCKIIPFILLDNSAEASISGDMSIYNIEFRPTYTEYSTGFINTSNLVQTWMKNNQKSLNQDQLEGAMRYYLLPYQATQKNNFL